MTGEDTDRARLIACAKLVEALPGLLSDESRRAIGDWLEERASLQDGQEDPGAVIVEGLAFELAIAAAFRDIAAKLDEG